MVIINTTTTNTITITIPTNPIMIIFPLLVWVLLASVFHKGAKCTFSQRPLETLRGNRWFPISCSLSREYKWKWLSKMSCSLNPPPLGQKWFQLKLGRLKRLIWEGECNQWVVERQVVPFCGNNTLPATSTLSEVIPFCRNNALATLMFAGKLIEKSTRGLLFWLQQFATASQVSFSNQV